MTPEQAKTYTGNRYKELSQNKTLTVLQKLDIVNRIVQELRQFHNYVVLIGDIPVKGCTLDPHTQEVIYHVG